MTATIKWAKLSDKHCAYILAALNANFCVAEGSIRAGKTIDNCIIAAAYLEKSADKIHLASGSTLGNAKLNIGVCNGFGLEFLFRGRCHWGKYRDNDALFINTQTGEKIVVFTGGGKADSYKRILGNSYGLWIATEINEHHDFEDSRTSFIKVAMGRQAAATQPLRLWDLNPSVPHHPIYSDYIDKYRDEKLPGYLYEHFTIHDNLAISAEQLSAFEALYDKSSIWYRRDILGQRCVAEGLIYRAFADNPTKWAISPEQLRTLYFDEKRKGWKFAHILIGVDFGGNRSAHTFVCSAITEDWQLIALKSRRVEAHGVDTEQLTTAFLQFAAEIANQYRTADGAYCDSAEQAIINTFRNRAEISIYNSIKNEINDRIRATDLMLSAGSFKYLTEECESLVTALSECIWDKDKPNAWVRADDGTSDIDTLDAFEYSWEYYITQLIETQ